MRQGFISSREKRHATALEQCHTIRRMSPSPTLLLQQRRVSRNLKEQIKLHLVLNPSKSRSELVDALIEQEREVLNRLIDRETDASNRDAMQSVVDWLVVLADIMKTRPQSAP
jgi:hypothetical protein